MINKLQKYPNINDKQITEIPKYQLEKYINTYYRRREILNTEIQITEV